MKFPSMGKRSSTKVVPSHEAASDYDIATAYFNVNARQGEDVEIHIQPLDAKAGCILNGFEIDLPDPHKGRSNSVPANDDEHIDPTFPLTWTAPSTATAHFLYLGTDADAVAKATPQSPEFKGILHEPRFALTDIDHMKTLLPGA